MLTPYQIRNAMEQAVALQRSGRLAEAEPIYRQVLSVVPRNADALYLLALILRMTRRFAEAADLLHRAIAVNPNVAKYYAGLAMAIGAPGLGRIEQAIAAYRKAIELAPNEPILWVNLGNELWAVDRWPGLRRAAEAEACFRRAMELNPRLAPIYENLGGLLTSQGKHKEAMEAFRQAVALDEENPVAHWNYARALLGLGHFRQGWEEFEWRIKVPYLLSLDRHFPQPQWDGSDPAGKTILLHAEGGHGDALQFVRCVPQVVGRRATLILECQPALTGLFESIVGLDRIIARGQSLPEFDCHIPLQGLPRILGVSPSNIPRDVPYLSPPTDRVQRWAARLSGETKLRVGLSWAGSWVGPDDIRTRSIDVFTPLAGVAGVKFFGLQHGPESNQPPPDGMDFVSISSELNDFADLAALVRNLDLVISVDTSVAHLAGALGRPVWVLIPFLFDFRWMADRSDSPWYPTMRLFRQPASGDWAVPAEEIARALSQRAGQ
jgi:Flp pilus assembly protein TadD